MDENTPSIWLTGILEQPPTMIMSDGTSTIQFDLIIDGPDGPVEVAVEAAGASHAAFIATQRPGKGDRIVIHGRINDNDDEARSDVTADLIALAVSDERTRP